MRGQQSDHPSSIWNRAAEVVAPGRESDEGVKEANPAYLATTWRTVGTCFVHIVVII